MSQAKRVNLTTGRNEPAHKNAPPRRRQSDYPQPIQFMRDPPHGFWRRLFGARP
jgi:hypothetical protein